MEEIESTVKYIKSILNEDILKVIDFLERSNILSYSIRTEKVKEGDKVIEKPTDKINIEFLKTCSNNDFPQGEDLTGLCFLRYQGYELKNFKLYWKVVLSDIEKDLKSKCTYCNISYKQCPLKALGFIKKIVSNNNLSEREVFEKLLEKETPKYNNDKTAINSVAQKMLSITNNGLDFAGTEFFLQTDAFQIEKEENGKIYYRYLDFKIENKNLINNIKEFKNENKGLRGEISISEPNFNRNFSYMFDVSPIELAVFLKYYSNINQVDPMEVLKVLHNKCKTNESIGRIAYYKEYMERLSKIDCSENTKKEIRDFFTYVKNYSLYRELPYIPFNIALYSKNEKLCDELQRLILNFCSAFEYTALKNWVKIDVNTFIRRMKDSIDTFSQIEKMYNENDYIIFYNFEGVKSLNELRVDAFFAAIEKYYNINERNMTVFISDKQVLEDLIKTRPKFSTTIINKEIDVDDFDIDTIKDKIKKRLRISFEFDENLEKEIDKYIENRCSYNEKNSNDYIDDIFDEIVFNEFKQENKKINYNKEKISLKDVSLPDSSKARDVEEILKDFDNLVGLADVKNTVKELLKYIEYSNKIDTEGFANLNMVFKGNAGTGKLTVARLFTELLFKLGFIKTNKITEVSSRDLIGEFVGQTPTKTQKVIDRALDGVLFVDNANTIMSAKGSTTDYASECITTLVSAMENYKDRLVVIFSGWTMEMNTFMNRNQGLASMIGYELEFPDFTTDELWEIFRTEAEGNGFTLEDKVETRIRNLIKKNKTGRNFGNARYVINLFNSLVLTHASICENDSELKKITVKDIEKFESTKKDKERNIDEILNELNSLIGLDNIKEIINGFVALIEFNKKLERIEDINMHMIFKGNAGTGKTTVARLLAEIYYNLGYVKKNKLIEVQAKDLIGEYIGQTGPKTQAVIESALDGVLFVDEAYSIMQHRGTNASFTDECIATFLKAMEDYQGRLIIIFAGYTEEMKQFRDQNPGLKSRIGFELDFQDYAVEELLQIFNKKLNERELTIDEAGTEKLRTIFENSKKVENFGNGRFVDTTLQKIIIEHALRTRDIEDMEVLRKITVEDIKDIKAEESRKRIGF